MTCLKYSLFENGKNVFFRNISIDSYILFIPVFIISSWVLCNKTDCIRYFYHTLQQWKTVNRKRNMLRGINKCTPTKEHERDVHDVMVTLLGNDLGDMCSNPIRDLAFHIALTSLAKLWMQLFSLLSEPMVGQIWHFNRGMETSLAGGKLNVNQSNFTKTMTLYPILSDLRGRLIYIHFISSYHSIHIKKSCSLQKNKTCEYFQRSFQRWMILGMIYRNGSKRHIGRYLL